MSIFSAFFKPVVEQGLKAPVENSFKEKLSVGKDRDGLVAELDKPLGKEVSEAPNMETKAASKTSELDRPLGKEVANATTPEAEKAEENALTDEQRNELKEKTGMQDAALDRCTVLDNGDIKLSCINEDKLGQPSDVPYVQKTVNVEGVNIRVVMPEFKGKFEVSLPKELHKASDAVQFKHCVEQLSKAIQENPDLAKKFTPQQLEQVKEGAPRIKGLTWHHDAEPCRMVLVDAKTHDLNRHTGGKVIWGGGR